jgi:hypothetical protein
MRLGASNINGHYRESWTPRQPLQTRFLHTRGIAPSGPVRAWELTTEIGKQKKECRN